MGARLQSQIARLQDREIARSRFHTYKRDRLNRSSKSAGLNRRGQHSMYEMNNSRLRNARRKNQCPPRMTPRRVVFLAVTILCIGCVDLSPAELSGINLQKGLVLVSCR